MDHTINPLSAQTGSPAPQGAQTPKAQRSLLLRIEARLRAMVINSSFRPYLWVEAAAPFTHPVHDFVQATNGVVVIVKHPTSVGLKCFINDIQCHSLSLMMVN
ncbi:MAG: hypothetical protein OER56_02975 [Hyphomicrobiales bacterium]|nr:hypothetical protein [Hyphomicrobiales bacterium]